MAQPPGCALRERATVGQRRTVVVALPPTLPREPIVGTCTVHTHMELNFQGLGCEL